MPENSLTLAKAYQAAERRRVARLTGLRITDRGAELPAVIIHCPRCRFTASAKTEGRAINAISSHLVKVHMQEQK